MKKTIRYSSIASWCLIVFGLIHESAFVFSYLTMPEQEPVVLHMQNFNIEGTGAHIYSFYNGYALLMGVLLIVFGILNLVVIKNASVVLKNSATFLLLDIVVSLSGLIIAIIYFKFIVPIVLTGLATLFFIIAFINRNKLVVIGE